MRGFRDLERTQTFLSSFEFTRQYFVLKRHLLHAPLYRKQIATGILVWHRLTETTQNPSAF